MTAYDVPLLYEGLPVKEIGELAFKGCSYLSRISIPDSVERISYGAFWMSGLTSVDIPDSVTSIGNSAFAMCDFLKEVTVPDGVTSLGAFAFAYCNNLKKVTVGGGVGDIPDGAFCNSVASSGSDVYVNSSLREVILSSSVKEIAVTAFAGCLYLQNITYNGSKEEWDKVIYYTLEKDEQTGEKVKVNAEMPEAVGNAAIDFRK